MKSWNNFKKINWIVFFILIAFLIGSCKPSDRPDQEEENLKILTKIPEGDEVPLSTDGITVMFNKPMIPLTTLDAGRDKKIPIDISPRTPGKFYWLGTHGFIFRPDKPFTPATTYKVSLPGRITSLDGQRLENLIEWEFKTVRPRVVKMEPYEKAKLLPKNTTLYFQFNLRMDRERVEKGLQIVDAKTKKKINVKKKLIWSQDDHDLHAILRGSLPYDTEIEFILPKEIRAREGSLSMKEDFTRSYPTASSTFSVKRVGDYETGLNPGTEEKITAGTGICYDFSQPISKESFEDAFHVEVEEKSEKIKPYFYFSYSKSYPKIKSDGKREDIYGFNKACASFLKDYDQQYKFYIDPKKIKALSEAKFEKGKDVYAVRTYNASPWINSLLTKNILAPELTMKIPYKIMNVGEATLRIYRLEDTNHYSENVKSVKASLVKKWNPDLKQHILSDPLVSYPLPGTTLSLPIDPKSILSIDQERMKAEITQVIPLDEKLNKMGSFYVDLADLPDGQKLSPGLYLLEMMGTAIAKNLGSPETAYSAIQITPVSIAIKREANHVLIWATNTTSGKPMANLPVSIELMYHDWKKREKVKSAEGKTNKKGVAIFSGNWSGIKKKGESSFNYNLCAQITKKGLESYSCEKDHRLGSYKRVLSPDPHFFSYVYTDRPIYRPGDRVHFSSFIRQVQEGRYFMPDPDTPYTIKIYDANYTSIFEKEGNLGETKGMIYGEFDLENREDLPRGTYAIELKIVEQAFEKRFVVSSYRKPSFKIDLKANKDELVSREELEVKVAGSYFFGAPLRKAKSKWSIMTSSYIFSPEGFEEYNFVDYDLLYSRTSGDGDSTYYESDYEYDVVAEGKIAEDEYQWDDPRGKKTSSRPKRFFKDEKAKDVKTIRAQTDDKGLFTIKYKPDLKKYSTSQILSVEASVTDPSNQEVSGAVDLITHKSLFYLGLKPEKWVYGEKDTATWNVVSLDTQGKSTSRKNYTAEIYRREYKFIERMNARGYWEILFEHKDELLDTKKGKTDSNGKAQVSFEIPKGGTYRVVLKSSDSMDNEVQSASHVCAWGKGYVPWRLNEPQKLELVPDRKEYKVGDTAKILIKSLMPVSKALVTLERGRLLEYKIEKLGGGNAEHIEIPITEGMIPNIYLSVIAHAGEGKNNEPPLIFHGETEIHVETERKRLHVKLIPDREGEKDLPPIYKPREEVKVKIETTNANGESVSAHVMLSVADESVLRLLAYKLPDLVKKFYYNRPNSVISSSSLISLKAGDGGGKGFKRRLFKDTAYFEAHLQTDESGKGEFSFKLPDNLTTWVIEALAITNSKTYEKFEDDRKKAKTPSDQKDLGVDLSLTDNTFVGGERAKVMVTLPVLIRPALPRFAAWGDTVKAKVIVNNRNPNPAEGSIRVSLNGDGSLLDESEIPFKLTSQEEKSYLVPFKVNYKDGEVKLTAEALNKSGEVLDAFEKTIPVLDRYAPEVTATAGMTKDKVTEQIDIPESITADKGGVDVSLKASLGLAMASPMRELIDFPYGCSEQKSATLIAMLMARDLSESFGEKYFDTLAPFRKKDLKGVTSFSKKLKLLDNRIEKIINELISDFQTSSGGIKYWPNSHWPSVYASTQTLWAFTLARNMAFSVNISSYSDLKGFVYREIDNEKTPLDRKAYILWVLSLAGSWKYGVADQLFDQYLDLSVSGLAYFFGALTTAQDVEIPETKRDKIEQQLKTHIKHHPRSISWPSSDFFWSSSEKNTSLATFGLLMKNPKDTLIPKAMAFLLNRKRAHNRPVTQDNLYLSWLGYYLSREMEEEKTDFTATFTLADKKFLKEKFNLENLLEEKKTNISMEKIKSEKMPADMVLSKDGDGTLYYDLVLKYYLPPEKTPTREEGLIISREYYALDDVKEEKSLTEFQVGENYKGKITLVVPDALNYILIREPLPAGFEPIDMTLATSSRAAQIMARESEDITDDNRSRQHNPYDDVFVQEDYGMDFGFTHQEIRDDSIIWSDKYVPPGIYHIRYPVRATTSGDYLMSGAYAFEFYEPEIFGRSRAREIVIK